jgi:hypothetical protein
VTEGVTVTSLFASLLQKISVDTHRLCRIVLNQTLSRKFKKWCKLLSRVKANLRGKKLRKMTPAFFFFFSQLHSLIFYTFRP